MKKEIPPPRYYQKQSEFKNEIGHNIFENRFQNREHMKIEQGFYDFSNENYSYFKANQALDHFSKSRSQSTDNKIFQRHYNFSTNQSTSYNYNQAKKISLPLKNNNVLETNSKLILEAEESFKILKIESNMNDWMNNCQRWFFKNIIAHFWSENLENIFELNQELNKYYGKYLHEIEYFDHTFQNTVYENKYSRITIEALLVSDFFKGNHLQLDSNHMDFKKIQEINKKITTLIETRKKLEMYLTIPGYENNSIR